MSDSGRTIRDYWELQADDLTDRCGWECGLKEGNKLEAALKAAYAMGYQMGAQAVIQNTKESPTVVLDPGVEYNITFEKRSCP